MTTRKEYDKVKDKETNTLTYTNTSTRNLNLIYTRTHTHMVYTIIHPRISHAAAHPPPKQK